MIDRIKKNSINLFLLFIISLFVLASIYFDFISQLPKKEDVHFNLLTISTVFSGFLFTSLGLLVGFVDKANMPELEEAGFTGQYFNGILIGISVFLLSISISLVLIVNPNVANKLNWYNAEVFLLVGGIIYFVKAVKDVFEILKKVREHIKKEYRKSQKY